MSNTISTLLLRNLSDVFAEIDPMRRRNDPCGVVYSEPLG
jgi:hypothetical protein